MQRQTPTKKYREQFVWDPSYGRLDDDDNDYDDDNITLWPQLVAEGFRLCCHRSGRRECKRDCPFGVAF